MKKPGFITNGTLLTINGLLSITSNAYEEYTDLIIADNSIDTLNAQSDACISCPQSGACDTLLQNQNNSINELFDAIQNKPDILRDSIPKIPNLGIQDND